jgi:hypothetical protein
MRAPEITRREVLLVALGACLLSVVMNWPLLLHLGTTVPRDIGDPLAEAWQPAWGGHALLHQPLDFFDANRFWPLEDSLAFGDALIGYAPAGMIGSGVKAALVRYDLLFLFAYALAFFGAYLLARELGIGPAGAAVAGAAFAFAPFRLEQDGHMQVISSGGIPLALAFAARALRLRGPWWMLAAWVVAWWQVSLGFVLGLPFGYLIGLLVLIGGVIWLIQGRPPVNRGVLLAGAAGAVFFLAATALIARPYFHVADDFPESKRSPSEVEEFSGPMKVFITAPEENWVWGDATAGVREELVNIPEKTLFPGLVIVVFALIGLGSRALDPRLRIGLAIAVVVISAMALGFQEEDGWLWPYRVVYDALPGWEGIRTPGRMVTFSSLALAILAAAGTESMLRAIRLRALPPWTRTAACGLVVLAIVVEGRGLPFDPTDAQAQPEVPPAPVSTADLPTPQLHLPADNAKQNRAYQLWSSDEFPDLVNGRASTNPDLILQLIYEMNTFPDRRTVETLRRYGVRTVVLHTDLTLGTPQQGAAKKPVAGLPLTRRSLPGGLVVYELDSSSASSGPSARSRRGAVSESG